MKNRLTRIINILSLIFIGLGLFLLLRHGDWGKIIYIKDHINYSGLLLILVLGVICQFLIIFRWYLLLIPIKNSITLKSIFRIAVNAILLNHIAPGKVGYPAKAYFLKKTEDIPISTSAPSLFAELFLDYSLTGVLFIIAALIGGYFNYIVNLISTHISFRNSWLIAVILIILFLFAIIFKQKLQATNIFNNMITAMQLTRKRTDIVIATIIITIVYLMIWFISDYLLARSLGYKLPLIFLIFVGAFTNIIALLAPLPGGLGVREISGAYLFKVFFDLGEVAIIMVLFSRLATFITLSFLYLGERILKLLTSDKKIAPEIPGPELTTYDLS